MGYFKDLEIDIMSMAHDMGDDYGQDADTVLTIARVLDIPVLEVQRVLSEEYDVDPGEYAEHSADEDAVHYGLS
jgi:energy-converting hydrogenase A subunit M